jgi:hypothetical protein
MPAEKLLLTSALLGLFTLLGGCYGVLYCFGKIMERSKVVRAAHACYVGQCLVATAIVGWTPLLVLWKLLVVASCVAYWFIPPGTLRYLVHLHESRESRPC